MTSQQVYTPDEVAAILKVHPLTVYRLLQRKQLPGFKVGTAWRITQEALDSFMRGERPEEPSA